MQDSETNQSPFTDYRVWMGLALEEAKASLKQGNHGFGAVVIREGTVISRAHDEEETAGDPTSHAELNAIRLAAGKIGRDLSGCALVCTHEPCPMCAAAVIWSGIRELAYGYSIREAIHDGRRRIDLPCEELFERAGVDVRVSGGVMQRECSMLYRADVRREITRLRGASDDSLRGIGAELAARRVAWFQEKRAGLELEPQDLPIAGYNLLLTKLGIKPEQASIVEWSADRVVFHSANFCPTLEACKLLDLDTRRVCSLMTEEPARGLIKQLDARLEFARNYSHLRPYADSCEEMIAFSGSVDAKE